VDTSVDHSVDLQAVACTFPPPEQSAAPYTAIENVSLRIGYGEFVSIVGPTGCGKSTLLNIAAGLISPSAGLIKVL
jgi:NitT/TauT family transport system ATP-binding protein